LYTFVIFELKASRPTFTNLDAVTKEAVIVNVETIDCPAPREGSLLCGVAFIELHRLLSKGPAKVAAVLFADVLDYVLLCS
jgi:hypothetical protein